MKRSILFSAASAAAMALGLSFWSSPPALAQDNYAINTFDSDTEAGQWSRWWGAATQSYEFDPSMDADNNPASGSLKVTVDFDVAAYGGDNQFAARGDFAGGTILDGTQYTNLVFDLRWDPSSPQTSAGNYGSLEYGLGPTDWSQVQLGTLAVPLSAGSGWLRVQAPIDPATPKLEAVTRVWLKIWSGNAGGLTGRTVFWLDNVKLLANTNTVEPAPTLTIRKAAPGLMMVASAPDAQYQRQSVRTLATDTNGFPNYYSWVLNPTPVTYSLTVRDYPDAAHSGFQTHFFLVPEIGMPYGPNDTSIDWNASHVVFIQIANNADGTALGRFMYKTNAPSSNTMFWNADPGNGPAGALAMISNPTPVGTWIVTFNSDTDITLTTPTGTSTNFVIPAEAAALFSDPVYAYFGIQPNSAGNIGQGAVLSRIQISGVLSPLDDPFTGETLDVTKWQIVAADPSGVVQIPSSAAWWLRWSAPATGYGVQSSPDLAAGSWMDPGLTNVIQIGSQKSVLVPAASLPSAVAGFFRLVKP